MPDYGACTQSECPKAKTCARYLMVWSERQCVFAPEYGKNGCDDYWDVWVSVPFEVRGENE